MARERAAMNTPEMRHIDSLRLRALLANPFFHPSLDDVMVERWIEGVIVQENRQASVAEVRYAVRRYLEDNRNYSTQAWLAMSRGDFASAARFYGVVAQERPRNYAARADRAHAFMLLGNGDSAKTSMEDAIRVSRAADTAAVRYSYQSKQSLLYALGRICEQSGDAVCARRVYEEALVEHLGFWAAHVRLGILALGGGDTTRALRELQSAVEVREDDYSAQLMYGYVLGVAGRFDSAVVHLRRAADLEPWASAPYDLLGQILDVSARPAEAMPAYERFLQLARQDDPSRIPVTQRVAALRAERR
jgi:tetratricopeptide (TPR) repeat protein